MSLWIMRVYLKAGPVVELIYAGADKCRRDVKMLADEDSPALADDYGKVLVIETDSIAAVMTSDYDAELSGVDQIEKCKAGLRAKMQQRAAAQAGLIGGGGMVAIPGNGRLVAP